MNGTLVQANGASPVGSLVQVTLDRSPATTPMHAPGTRESRNDAACNASPARKNAEHWY